LPIIDPEKARENQLNSLLNWKNKISYSEKVFNFNFSKYFEIPNIAQENLSKYAEKIQALLINPPWSIDNENYYDLETFVSLIL